MPTQAHLKCNADSELKKLSEMECTVLIERLVNVALPAPATLHWLLLIITLFIWGCITYLVYRSLAELSSIAITSLQIAGNIASTAIKESFALVREILQAISQVLTCINKALSNLFQVLQKSIMAIWAQLTRDNLSLLVALGMIIYIFPDLCNVIKDM